MGPEGLLAGTRNRVVGMAPPPVDQAYNMALVAVVAVVAVVANEAGVHEVDD